MKETIHTSLPINWYERYKHESDIQDIVDQGSYRPNFSACARVVRAKQNEKTSDSEYD